MKKRPRKTADVLIEKRITCLECGWVITMDPMKPWQHRKAKAHANATGHTKFEMRKGGVIFLASSCEPHVKTGDETVARCETCQRVVVAGKITPGYLAKVRAHEQATGHHVRIGPNPEASDE